MIAQLFDLARAHAPLIAIVAPLAGAALAAITPQARLSWAVAVFALIIAAGVALDGAVVRLTWPEAPALAQEGLALAADSVGQFLTALIAIAASLALFSGAAILGGARAVTAPFGIALSLCVVAGWSGALAAPDLITLLLAVEIAWLASIGLAALFSEGDKASLNAALRMVSAGGAFAAIGLLGSGLVGRAVGTLELGAIANTPAAAPTLAAAGAILVVLSLAMKAGVAPLQAWAAPAFGRGGGFAALMIGIVGVAGALAVLVRLASYLMPAPELGGAASAALAALGAASVVIGSVQAIGAVNLRRLASYACASQGGCILLCLALGSPAGFAAALIQIFALTSAMLALLVGSMAAPGSGLAALDGLGRRAPLAGIGVTFGALSLMGAPLTIGFLGQWRLIEAALGAGWWWAAGAALGSSLAAALYGGRLIERVYFRRASEAGAADRSIWRFALAPALIAAVFAIALGFEPSALLNAASRASMLQLGHVP